MIPNSKNMKKRNMRTLKIAGTDFTRAKIIILSFSNFVTALRGLKTRKILRVLMKLLEDSTVENIY